MNSIVGKHVVMLFIGLKSKMRQIFIKFNLQHITHNKLLEIAFLNIPKTCSDSFRRFFVIKIYLKKIFCFYDDDEV